MAANHASEAVPITVSQSGAVAAPGARCRRKELKGGREKTFVILSQDLLRIHRRYNASSVI
jgi:hypothetical protein